MRSQFLDLIRCPRCRAERSFDLHARDSDDREVRAGELTCRACGLTASVDDGIVDLLHDPPDFVVREAAGLARFADRMRAEGWNRERVLNLPYEQSGYWFQQAATMERLLSVHEFKPGQTLLDVGANTCWASNIFARRGLNVVALDIAAHELQGLRTADWWFKESGVYFERVLSVMFDPALASDSFDYVFCSEVLHHNDPENLRRTLEELYRVLKPGGRLLAVNEPLKFLTDRKGNHDREVAEYEGHEHIYYLHEYLLAAHRAGFAPRVMRPNTTPFFRGDDFVLYAWTSAREAIARGFQQALRSTPRGAKAYTLYKLLFGSDVSLSFVGEKRG